MALTIGAVLLAAFLVPPQRSGYLDVAGYRALRAASWAAAGWTAAAVLLVPLNVADALGRPVGDVLDPGLLRRPGAPAERGHRLDADRAGGGGRARRLPNRADLGMECRPVRAGAARPAAGGADRPLGRRGSARPGQRQPGSARAGRVAVGGRPGRGARHRRRARTGPGGGAGHRGSPVLPARPGLLAGAGRDRRAERRRADPARRAARFGVRGARAGQGGRAARARRHGCGTPPVHGGAGRARRTAGAVAARRLRGAADAGHDRAGRRPGAQRAAGHRLRSLPHRGDPRLRPGGAADARPAGLRLALQPAVRHRGAAAGRGLRCWRCAGCAGAGTPGRSAARWPGWPAAPGCWWRPAPGSAATARRCSARTWPST